MNNKRNPQSLDKFLFQSEKEEERFWSYVDRTEDDDACWLWTGATDFQGYSRFNLRGEVVYGHRIMAANYVGFDDETQVTRHICSNKSCVNANHLATGSPSDNRRDYLRNAGGRRFKARDIIKMRKAFESGEKVRDVAEVFGIHPNYASAIKCRRVWEFV